MSTPTPLRSFLGGVGLSLPIYSLTVLNGNVFGISGFLHRTVRGNREAASGVIGLIAGGIFAGLVESHVQARELAQSLTILPSPLLLFSGFLVGLGTKMANGCTSGHMLAGISRLSKRSIISTAIFFTFGSLTARAIHGKALPNSKPPFWGVDETSQILLLVQAVPLAISAFLYFRYSSSSATGTFKNISTERERPSETTVFQTANSVGRLFTYFITALEFGLALRVSDLSNPLKVLSFLVLPLPLSSPHRGFDPSLAFLAASALPLSLAFYQFGVKPLYTKAEDGTLVEPRPRLGGKWSIPRPDQGKIDARLILGSALFGVGWGLAGVCPGPALVNLGRSIVHFLQHGTLDRFGFGNSHGLAESLTWLCAFVLGGSLT